MSAEQAIVENEIVVLDNFAPVFQSTKRYINMRGGRASAKSFHAALKCLSWLLGDDFQRVLCIRKYAEHIERSQYQMFKDFVEKLYPFLSEEIEIKKSPMKIINKRNGNEIVFAGVDDPEKLKSITNITKVWIEEPTELEEDDLKGISLSLRGPQITDYPQILLTYNPISETHWLKARFWDEPPSNTFNHTSTYLTNPFLTKADTDEIESYKETDPDYYKIIALNEWGVIRTGQEFFHNFRYNIHVTEEELEDRNRAVVLTFDFNRLPYSTCLLRQILYKDGKLEYRIFDEICLKAPLNSIEDIRDEMENRHPWIREIFFTGDPSGRSQGQKKSRDEANSYEEMIETAFARYCHNRSNVFLTSAPPLAKRKHAMSEILSGKHCTFRVSRKCKNLINDFESLQVDKTGGYVKKRITDKKSGASYEQGGHCMDALIYDLAGEFRGIFFSK